MRHDQTLPALRLAARGGARDEEESREGALTRESTSPGTGLIGRKYADTQLRLPRLKAGDSDQLLLRSFRLRRANASQFRAVSSGSSTGRVRPKPAPVAPTLDPGRPAVRPVE